MKIEIIEELSGHVADAEKSLSAISEIMMRFQQAEPRLFPDNYPTGVDAGCKVRFAKMLINLLSMLEEDTK